MTKQVSQEYIDGILEGRQLLNLIEPSAIEETARREISFCENVGFWAGANLHSDFVKGMKDFWQHRLEKI